MTVVRSATRVRLALVAIVGLGLIVRLAHAWCLADTAFPRMPLVFTVSDMHAYWEWAQRIRAGDLLGRDTYHPRSDLIETQAVERGWSDWLGRKTTFHWAPLYPYALAGLQGLVGASLLAVLVVQLALGALQPLVVFFLARRLFAARVALLAAVVMALYGPVVFYQGVMLRDWIPPIVEPLALVALLRARDGDGTRAWTLAGAALALALLVKEGVLTVLPLAFLWIVWERWPDRRRMARAVGCAALGLLLGVSPLLVRNALVGAPWLAVSDRAPEAIIDGLAADASPIGWKPDLATAMGIAARSDGSVRSTLVATLATYEGDYRRLLAKELLKLRGLADPYEVPNNTSFYYGLEISPPLRYLLRYGFVFPLGLAGLLLAVPAWRRHRLTVLYLAGALAGPLIGTVLDRYRLVFVPVLAVYGAAALVGVLDALRAGRVAGAVGRVGLVLGLGTVQWLWLPVTEPALYPRLDEYLLATQVYVSENRIDRAVAELDRMRGHAILAEDSRMPATAAMEGNLRLRRAADLVALGRRDAARSQLARAEAAYEQASGADLRIPYLNLGQLYAALGDGARARRYLELFLSIEPAGPLADQARRLLASLAPGAPASP